MKYSDRATQNQSFGNDSSMASFISMWNRSRDRIEDFLLKANSLHPTIKFAAEISETETTFLYTKVYKGVRFNKEYILDVRMQLSKPQIPFNTRISIRVTHQASRKALSKEKC